MTHVHYTADCMKSSLVPRPFFRALKRPGNKAITCEPFVFTHLGHAEEVRQHCDM